jgi:NAD(P)-dependent dehydrogenase (short-subunit alcohol dehydrogenase family)
MQGVATVFISQFYQVGLDVTDPVSIRSAVAHAETEMGAIDILVNNSGVGATQRLTEVAPEDYDYVMNTNTRGAFFVASMFFVC